MTTILIPILIAVVALEYKQKKMAAAILTSFAALICTAINASIYDAQVTTLIYRILLWAFAAVLIPASIKDKQLWPYTKLTQDFALCVPLAEYLIHRLVPMLQRTGLP